MTAEFIQLKCRQCIELREASSQYIIIPIASYFVLMTYVEIRVNPRDFCPGVEGTFVQGCRSAENRIQFDVLL